MKYRGLFVGLTTLDFVYAIEHYPQANQKVVAQKYLTTAGGPATNAAVAFSYFGNQGRLLTVLGQHPITQLIRADLKEYSVEIVDMLPEKTDSPPVSSIIATTATGERAVISINAIKSQSNKSQIPEAILSDIDIILIDGHQMEVSWVLAEVAKSRQIPVVIDGGSWKSNFDRVLPFVDYAICSANFYPPQCQNSQDVFEFLQEMGISRIAITQGEGEILYCDRGKIANIPVPAIEAVDTMGAGDIFHGAFCHYILQEDFATALDRAAQIASKSCQFLGTRAWYYSS
ncbi:sugar kinase [Myxosarcina sp. GI1]|uniref:sugar kinase n=1 Tax=Myxosarcina sp. GI1 TaxID=1541065 RepID=UPI0005610CD7|nr:sugar kinase [Myxosarcina sp. GI1]